MSKIKKAADKASEDMKKGANKASDMGKDTGDKMKEGWNKEKNRS